MKIAIIGPGIMAIPPKGWGAVEILIHDMRCALEDLGHDVYIVNVKNKNEIIQQTNKLDAEFVHIQYDDHVDIIPHLTCKNIAMLLRNVSKSRILNCIPRPPSLEHVALFN